MSSARSLPFALFRLPILGYRKMTDARHGNPHGAVDLRHQFFTFLETGGRIVFVVHDVNWTARDIDQVN
jgi:hypothetical protein